MKVTLTYLLLIAAYLGYTQNQEISINWERAYGGTEEEAAYTLTSTSDGGFAFAGFTSSHNGDIQSGNFQSRDFWVVKIEKDGQIEWEKTYGGSGDDIAYAILELEDKSFLIGGYTKSSDGDVKSLHGGQDYWLIKINKYGSLIWEHTYGGAGNEYIRSIESDNEGNGYVLVGTTTSNDGDVKSKLSGPEDGWVINIDSVGTIIWENTYGNPRKDHIYSVCSDNGEGYFLVGDSEYQQSPNVTDFNLYVVKINNKGDLDWHKTYGGTDEDVAFAIKPFNENQFIISGYTDSNDGDVQSTNQGDRDVWVLKIDNQGRLLWENSLGGSKKESSSFEFDITNSNEIIVGGYAFSNDGDIQSGNKGNCDALIFCLDSKGNLLWEKTFGGSLNDNFYSLKSISQNEIIIGGSTYSDDGDVVSAVHGGREIWIVDLSVGSPTKVSQLNDFNETFTVYPNPADNYIHIYSKSKLDSYEFRIYDLSGKEIFHKQLIGESNLNIDCLKDGMYLYQLNTDENHINGKFVKQ